MKQWNTERDQIAALFDCIESAVSPKNNNDDVNYIAWRLSEIGMNLLGKSEEIAAMCKMFGIDDLQAED